MKFRSLVLIFLLSLTMVFVGCKSKEVEPTPEETTETQEAPMETEDPEEGETETVVIIEEEPVEEEQELEAPREEPEPVMASLSTVYFDFDESDIEPQYESALRDNYEWIKDNPEVRIQLEGHADERGTNQYNLALGERRAKSVLDYLVGLGANPEQFTIISFGEERPAVLGSNEAAWAKNRRVEFTVF